MNQPTPSGGAPRGYECDIQLEGPPSLPYVFTLQVSARCETCGQQVFLGGPPGGALTVNCPGCSQSVVYDELTLKGLARAVAARFLKTTDDAPPPPPAST